MTALELETLALLSRWIDTAENRRYSEGLCSYPSWYGGDKEVLEESVALFERLDTRKP